jgi:DNA topoisomerase-1
VLSELAQGETKLRVLAGRYGPYVTDGTTNASIPRGANPEAITFEEATQLLEARRNAAPSPRDRAPRRRAAAPRAAAGRTRRKTAGASGASGA